MIEEKVTIEEMNGDDVEIRLVVNERIQEVIRAYREAVESGLIVPGDADGSWGRICALGND